jgi:hypothetical protein
LVGFRRFFLIAAAASALTACQSTANKPVDLGLGGAPDPASAASGQIAAAEPGAITDVELRAYCPQVVLRAGTSSYRTHEGQDEEDPSAVIYQAMISETSRACTYGNGMINMNVALAGRVVPGPKGREGQITMPIRVAVTRGDEVLYSQLHRHPVQVATGGATQFIFTDAAVTFPQPTQRNVTVFVGYDEGPYDTP